MSQGIKNSRPQDLKASRSQGFKASRLQGTRAPRSKSLAESLSWAQGQGRTVEGPAHTLYKNLAARTCQENLARGYTYLDLIFLFEEEL